MLKRITMLMPLLIGALLFAGAGEVDAARCKTTGLLIKTTSCSYSTKKSKLDLGFLGT